MSDIIVEKDSDVFAKMTGVELKGSFSNRNTDYQGDDTLLAKVHRDLEAQPLIKDACDSFIAQIKAEEREDMELPIGDFRVNDRGVLVKRDGTPISQVSGLEGFEMLPQAWAQLVQKAPNGVDRKLASNVNSWLHRKRANLVGRTFNPVANSRSMYSLVTQKYQAFDADRVAAQIAAQVPAECRGNIEYLGDGGRFEINAALARPFEVKGDLHQIIISVRSSDNGTLGQRVYFKAHRLKCTNGIFVAQKALISNSRHIGDPNALRDNFTRGLAMATEAMDSFSHLWGTAMTNKFICAKTGDELSGPAALERLAMHKGIHVPHERPKALLERVMGAYEKEPGDSIADVINAVTRTAHEGLTDFRSKWFGPDLEIQAGEILNGAHVLAPLTEEQREKLDK